MRPEFTGLPHPALRCLPMLVLGLLVGGVFFALTVVIPPLLPATEPTLPGLTRILPFLTRHALLVSMGLLVAGGITVLAAPQENPFRITAWFLGAAFILGLWGIILILVPESCSSVEAPLP